MEFGNKLLPFESLHVDQILLKLLVIVCASVPLVLLIRLASFLSDHPFLKSCSIPGLRSKHLFIYFTILKSVYRRSADAFPPLCLALQTLCGICRIFERERICRFYLGFKPVVVFYAPETVEAVLSSTTIIDKAAEYGFLHPWLGTGLLTSTGDKWRKRRKLLTSSFHFSLLEDFIPTFHMQSSILVSKLKAPSTEPWIDVVPLVTACTLDIICETAMGIHIGAQSGDYNDYVQAIREVGDIVLYRVMRPWLQPNIIFNCSSSGRKFNEHIQQIQDLTRKVIKEKKMNMLKLKDEEEKEANGRGFQKLKRRVFLELLLEHHFNDPSFTEEDIREEVDTFMFEGHDTTAMALSWALYFLGLDKGVQKKVHLELDAIFLGDIEREVTREDLSQMKYLECVIKETLRLHPSVPIIGREVNKSFKVLDHTIHEGSLCLILPLMLHQDSKTFKNPERFIPERFLPEHCVGRNPYAYVPFSAGPRNCIGQRFALMEEKTVLANVMRRFHVTSLDTRDKVNVFPNLVIRNVEPVRMRFTPRE